MKEVVRTPERTDGRSCGGGGGDDRTWYMRSLWFTIPCGNYLIEVVNTEVVRGGHADGGEQLRARGLLFICMYAYTAMLLYNFSSIFSFPLYCSIRFLVISVFVFFLSLQLSLILLIHC